MHLSTLERRILNLIQKEIPLCPEPFKILSKAAGLKEKEFLKSLRRLKDKGIIHSYVAHINHKKLVFISSLIALKVPFKKIESIARKIIRYPEVTHCFLRQGKYNLWFVFICLKKKKLEECLNRLAKQLGRDSILSLPTKRQFKLKTNLKL